MGRPVLVLIVLAFAVCQGQAQFKNEVLAEADAGTPQNPAIAISRKNPKNIVVGAVPDNVIYSKDGGQNWVPATLKSPYGVNGAPGLVSDIKGEFYYHHLAKPGSEGSLSDRIVIQKSTDGGVTWSEGDFAGYNPPKDQGKVSLSVHPRKQILYVTWTQFDKYGLNDSNCHSNIMFSMSSSGGKKWSKPVQVSQTPGNCLDDGNTARGGVSVIDYQGRVFAAWANQGKVFMDRSFNGGTTWLTNDLAIMNQDGGWAMKVPGLNRYNGTPVLKMDNSKSRLNGSVYLLWADQRNGEDDTDIWIMRSTNQGDFWTQPLRINQDEAGKHQFMPAMAIDDETGYIYVVYYDRRAYDDSQTDVYLAYSTDGGASFKEVKVSETPFTPDEGKPFGEYIGIDAYKGVITPVWTRIDNGRASVITAVVQETDLIKK